MKFISYHSASGDRLALLEGETAYDIDQVDSELPGRMSEFVSHWTQNLAQLRQSYSHFRENASRAGTPVAALSLMAPVPFPPSVRDGYAFRQHVANARRNRGSRVPPEFDQFPVFYFSNHHAVRGPGLVYCMPDHFEKLDFELEVAIMICQKGRNIPAREAHHYIGGLLIMNDLSARRLQAEEMVLSLGPAKGKDFATTLGPALVTLDELSDYRREPPPGHTGDAYSLAMQARVNGIPVSTGNLADMQWTFAELIERSSYGAELYPGDLIGSGTVGTGCFLELNGTALRQNPDAPVQWLRDGDVIALEVEGLGVLCNTVAAEKSDYSLLRQKKTASS
jgi:fumarylacetoacetate (FAA) hydrolase